MPNIHYILHRYNMAHTTWARSDHQLLFGGPKNDGQIVRLYSSPLGFLWAHHKKTADNATKIF